MVPDNAVRGTPVLSATLTYMAMITAAGELIVMEVLTVPRSIPANSVSMSARESTATPARPTSPLAKGSSESRPEQGGHVEGGRQPVATGAQ